MSIGKIGTGAFDGSTPSINIGDSDSGFIGSADGVIDIHCNNDKVGYINQAGLHMLKDIFANVAVRAGNGKKLSLKSDSNSTLSATFNLWGNADRPTVIELNDDQGWHLYSQRNTDGSIRFTVNGDITAGRSLHAGNADFTADGNINGSVWGGWLKDWINNNFNRKNTASLGDYGWVRDESTGFIMQWGTLSGSNGTYNFPRVFPAACFAVFVTNTSSQGALVDNAFGYPVNNSQFFAATKASNGAGTGAYPVAWLAIGR
ncbi:phage tail protein [Salmonella enterica]